MPAIWDAHFGYLRDAVDQALILGEWGGEVNSSQYHESEWTDAFAQYLIDRDLRDQFYWCLNGNGELQVLALLHTNQCFSDKHLGILEGDWFTLKTSLLEVINSVQRFPTQFFKNDAGKICVRNIN